jgi:hypothetical protein
MWEDPIVEEIHAIREQISEESNFDFKRIGIVFGRRRMGTRKGLLL